MPDALDHDPREMRARIRAGQWHAPTAGCCPGFEQANLVVLPHSLADEFLGFCRVNPGPCPLLEVTAPGDPEPARSAPGADLRTDLPRFRVYRAGRLDGEPTDVLDLWREDLVGFLLGCSFTFDHALQRAGIPVRHIEEGKNVSMYVTSRSCVPFGRFAGPLVVTMRPVPSTIVERVTEITAAFPLSHGAPVHIGDAAALGISDLDRPDFGDPVSIHAGETTVFWACGVTPQAVAMRVEPELMVAHAPGHMFITDLESDARKVPG